MSLAEELLRSSPSLVGTDSSRIVIGEDRFVEVPESEKKLGVQYDHNAETRVFDAPRYSDGRDLSELTFYVNYRRSDGSTGAHACSGLCVDPDDDNLIHFEWSISRHVMERKGALVFLICAKAVDSEGNETIHWNSELCTDLYVSEGLEVNETMEEAYPDIYTQLLQATSTVDEALAQANAAVEKLNGVEEKLDEATKTIDETKTEVESARNTATEAATNAQESATAASGSAESAQENAESAAESAKTATDKASEASEAAKTATVAVETLQGYAPIVVGTEALEDGVSELPSGTVYYQIEGASE